jgi:hypothetical protein
MRRVEIVQDPRSQRCWVAVDVKSGEAVMRLHDRGLLERLCESLEWKVVQVDKQGSRRDDSASGIEAGWRKRFLRFRLREPGARGGRLG